MTSRDVIVYEKLPEHEIEPVITSTQGEGVTQDESASKKGITNTPTVIESQRPSTEPPVIPASSTPHMDSVSTSSAPALDSVAELPASPPPSVQPRRSERTVRPSWIKAAGDAQKAHDLQTRAANKAVRDARTEHRELRARATAEFEIARPHKPLTDHEVAHLAYLAVHGPDTPLNYNEAV